MKIPHCPLSSIGIQRICGDCCDSKDAEILEAALSTCKLKVEKREAVMEANRLERERKFRERRMRIFFGDRYDK